MTAAWLWRAWTAVGAAAALSAGLIRLGHTLRNRGNPA